MIQSPNNSDLPNPHPLDPLTKDANLMNRTETNYGKIVCQILLLLSVVVVIDHRDEFNLAICFSSLAGLIICIITLIRSGLRECIWAIFAVAFFSFDLAERLAVLIRQIRAS